MCLLVQVLPVCQSHYRWLLLSNANLGRPTSCCLSLRHVLNHCEHGSIFQSWMQLIFAKINASLDPKMRRFVSPPPKCDVQQVKVKKCIPWQPNVTVLQVKGIEQGVANKLSVRANREKGRKEKRVVKILCIKACPWDHWCIRIRGSSLYEEHQEPSTTSHSSLLKLLTRNQLMRSWEEHISQSPWWQQLFHR